MGKKETGERKYDDSQFASKTKANKSERIRAENNFNTLNFFGIIDLFDQVREQMLSEHSDAMIGHEEDWSGIAIGWDFQAHEGNEGPYMVGKAIFATVKNEDVLISYSGLDSQLYLVFQINIRDLIYDGIEKARLPESL